MDWKFIMRRLLYAIYLSVMLVLTLVKLRRHGSKSILIVDIDNTITNTYEKWNEIVLNHQTYSTLSLKKETVNFLGLFDDHFVLFLTARPFITHIISKNYLKKNDIYMPGMHALISANPALKVTVIRMLVKLRYRIAYIDDLSYNHEKGEVFFYDKEIQQLKELEIDYFNFDFINFINRDED